MSWQPQIQYYWCQLLSIHLWKVYFPTKFSINFSPHLLILISLHPKNLSFYLSKPILICHNLFLFLITWKNLYFCKNSTITIWKSFYSPVCILFYSPKSFFIYNRVNNDWLKQKYYVQYFAITTKISQLILY